MKEKVEKKGGAKSENQTIDWQGCVKGFVHYTTTSNIKYYIETQIY